jgi:hypothetical protein
MTPKKQPFTNYYLIRIGQPRQLFQKSALQYLSINLEIEGFSGKELDTLKADKRAVADKVADANIGAAKKMDDLFQ